MMMSATHAQPVRHTGLRRYMQQAYMQMALSFVLAGLMALLVFHVPVLRDALYVNAEGAVTGLEPLAWFLMLLPVGIGFYFSHSLPEMGAYTAELGFWFYGVLLGIAVAVLSLVTTGESVAPALFIVAAAFGVLSLSVRITRIAFSGMACFLTIAISGGAAAALLPLSPLQFAASLFGVFIFAVFTGSNVAPAKILHAADEPSMKGPLSLQLTPFTAIWKLANSY